MTTSNTLTKTDLANILNEIVAIDGTDMTSQEVSDFVDSIDVAATHAVDYVIEEGTDGDWEYRKFNSGKYEATYTKPYSVARNTTWGSFYRSAEQTVNLPSFNADSTYSISGSINGAELISFLTYADDKVVFYIVRPSSSSTADSRRVNMILQGTWE